MVRHSRQHERKDRNAKNVGSLATWQTETLRVNNNNNSLSPQETFLPLTDNMINRTVKSFLLACVTLLSANAFAPTGVSSRRATPMMAVVDIDGEAAFDKTIQSAGSSLVVVDYSTTWCGPCKVIAPKFDELSEKYTDAVFLKVRTATRHFVRSRIL